MDTFLDAYDFGGKKIVPFCTSGRSGIEDAATRIQELAGAAATVGAGKRPGGTVTENDLEIWTAGLDL